MIASLWRAGDTFLSVAVAILLLLSGFFAMAETSLTRMNKSRARSLREQGRRGAKALVALTEAPGRFLNPLLLLVLICQLVSATMVGVLAGHLFGAAGIFVATAGEVIVIFVAFEAIPKNFAIQHPDEAALTSAPVVGRILRFWPVRWISTALLSVANSVIGLFGSTVQSSRVTESEVLAMADVAHEDDAIESEERNFIHSVIEFGDTIVREVMVPRVDMVVVDDTASVRDALDLAILTGRSRIPVIGEGVDDVVGMVNLRHLARLVAQAQGAEGVRAHMGEAHFVPETKRVASLLSEIRRAKVHLFVVVDEYGGTAGLVTLEDVLEELVGEITDESDPNRVDDDEQSIEEGIELSGRLNIDDANDEFALDLPKDGWDTVGGLVLDLAGGVPAVGDVFTTEHYRLIVVRMDGRRIEEVRVEPPGAAVTRAGFVAVLGRPNVGKSTLVNQLVGAKVAITAASPNTTRHAIRGILSAGDTQVILVDTPGLHRPRTTLGGRLNETARAAADGVDVVLAVIEAHSSIGPGDRHVIETALHQAHGPNGPLVIVVVNKIDRVGKTAVAEQLLAASAAVEEIAASINRRAVVERVEYFPVSAKSGEGTEALVAQLRAAMPESPFLFPDEEVSDVTEATWIAELVREQLVRKTSQELPHSIHCRVSEFEWPHVTVEILVERESQKGMVIGKGGALLKDVGIAARSQLPEGLYLELRVKVEPGWQKRDDVLDRFGY